MHDVELYIHDLVLVLVVVARYPFVLDLYTLALVGKEPLVFGDRCQALSQYSSEEWCALVQWLLALDQELYSSEVQVQMVQMVEEEVSVKWSLQWE